MMELVRRAWLCLLVGLSGFSSWVSAAPDETSRDHAVVLLFHRVSDSGPAATRVSTARFEALLDQLATGAHVVPLSRLLALVHGGPGVPPDTVALSFDDAYASVFTEAFPRLRERAMPFTVFVATDPVDRGYSDFMGWDQLRRLAESGLATFASHSLRHGHLEERTVAEERSAGTAPQTWRRRFRDEVLGADLRLRQELPASVVLRAFAYPYGEHSEASREELAALGIAAFTQGSGALGPESDAQRLPRFPVATGYDSDERLRAAVASRPLRFLSEVPEATSLGPKEEVPAAWSFELPAGLPRERELACYAAGEALDLARRDGRVTVSLPALRAGRNRVNCTVPAAGDAGAFHWGSRLWLLRDRYGVWLER